MELVADTSFLVGLWRRQAWALEFAKLNEGAALGIPWVVLGEFWHGAKNAGHDPSRVSRFLELGIPIVDPAPVIPHYTEICSNLQKRSVYNKIGQNDIWIAAVAVESGMPLVSRNKRHFLEIPNLELQCAETAT